MKKIIAFVIAAITLLSLGVPMTAQTETYNIEKWDITVTLPEGFDIINEDTPEDHPVFAHYGLSKSQYLAYQKKHSICLDMVSEDFNTRIYFQIFTDPDYRSYDNYRDASLSGIGRDLVFDESDKEVRVMGYGAYHHPQTKFAWGTNLKNGKYFTRFNGYFGGMRIYVSMDSYSSETSVDEVNRAIMSVMDSMILPAYLTENTVKGGSYGFGKDSSFTVTLPDDFYAVNGDVSADSIVFDIIGLPKEAVMDILFREDDGVSLIGINETHNIFVYVYCHDYNEKDLSSMSRKEMSLHKRSIVSTLKENGCEVKTVSQCMANQRLGLYLVYYNQEIRQNYLHYATIVDGQSIEIIYVPYNSVVQKYHERMFARLFEEFALVERWEYKDREEFFTAESPEDAKTDLPEEKDGASLIMTVLVVVIIVCSLFIIVIITAVIVVGVKRRRAERVAFEQSQTMAEAEKKAITADKGSQSPPAD